MHSNWNKITEFKNCLFEIIFITFKNEDVNIMEQAVIFIFGAISYSAIEILWRGHTHWTMALAGGLCAMLIYIFSGYFKNMPLLTKSLAGALIITTIEFCVGILVNVILKWNVWDYSSRPFNICGQICLLYSSLWFLLCIPIIKLFDYFRSQITL